MRRWQDRVLDLTKSNPLIGLNRSRVAKLQVTHPAAEELFSIVVVSESAVRMPLVRRRPRAPLPDALFKEPGEAELLVEPGDVTIDAKPADLMRRLRRIYDNSRTTLEERGITTLYLTFGTLQWRDELLGESVSPLWMVPCEFESKGPDAPLRLSVADEEAQVNPALEYYLRERHKVLLPGLPEEPDAQSLAQLLRAVDLAVREQKWDVTDEVWLSTFSFESLVIYRDLRALTETACEHAVVAGLARAMPAPGGSEALPSDLDSLPTPDTVPIAVLPTDSSQLEALTVAAVGRHVVVHGPPGTGKSQTIANMIADALAKNRTVLFVSAKMAALNVVYDRLRELGLERFCLEAHSTKAGKQKVIEELRRTLEAETSLEGDALDRELQALLRIREELNGYARELHRRIDPLGTTMFRANAELAQFGAVRDIRGPLPWPDPLTAARDDLDECLQALEHLAANAAAFDQRDLHPWRGFIPERFGLIEQESLEMSLGAVAEACSRLAGPAARLEPLVSGARDLALREWQLLRGVLSALSTTRELPKDWWRLTVEELAAAAALLQEASSNRAELDALLTALREVTVKTPAELAALLAPVRCRFGSWYAPLRPSYWQWRRDVRLALQPGVTFDRQRCTALFAEALRAIEIERWLADNRAAIEAHLPPSAPVTPAELTNAAEAFTVAGLCRQALDAVGREPTPITAVGSDLREAARGLLHELPADTSPLAIAFQRLDADWPERFAAGKKASDAPLPLVLERARSLLGSFDRAREWVLLRRALGHCADRGLTPFVQCLGDVSAAEAPRCFKKRFYRLWVSAVLEREPRLGAFTEAKGRDLIEKFRLLDERVRRLAICRAQAVASSASARVRAAQDILEGASEVGILRYELQKKKRVKPLRKLFTEIPHVLQALKPCLLMSPISVSTYLKPGAFRFDLVVFDEASQLPTAEAVPSILRAQQVAVAGDSNQLPPTSFFEAALVQEDEEDTEDNAGAQAPLESLLDDCVAVVPVFQEAHLRWHYRSRDERLIKFSNSSFYNNKLITFPSANAGSDGQGVRFVYVPDGVYDRGRSRTNRREARVVARIAVEHFDRFPDRSLGIVSLNISQREAIEDAIAEELAVRPDLAPLFDRSGREPVFVKSLENVQGDERDTMLISVGYGRDPHGGLSLNFGPINADGGWRRLNVLVTRAKWECILVSSLRAADLAGVNPNNVGAISLRNFLEFAERRGELPAEPATPTQAETNDFEDAVRAALVERGFTVDAQVGAGRYRIDLAVRDRHHPTRYTLGIECDGATYHSSRTARDRDILRQQVLQRMGWRIHRVWSTEWFYNREAAIKGMLRSIEQAESSPDRYPVYAPPLEHPASPAAPVSTGPQSTNPHQQASRKYQFGISYQLYQPARFLSREHLLDPRHSETLASTVAELVLTEGPIHHDLLIERLKELHGVQRAGTNVRANVELALRSAARHGSVRYEPRSPFYRHKDQSLRSFRLPTGGLRRPIEHIAPEEIALAILYLVEDQFGVAEDQLPTAVARLFGIERLPSESADLVREVVDDLVKKAALRRSGPLLHLA
jgi:very-short-patch-repair endonuclease